MMICFQQYFKKVFETFIKRLRSKVILQRSEDQFCIFINSVIENFDIPAKITTQ